MMTSILILKLQLKLQLYVTCKFSEYSEYVYLFKKVHINIRNPQLIDELNINGNIRILRAITRTNDTGFQPSKSKVSDELKIIRNI